ncbi:MAG: DUF3078 domain-containing protein [Chlorobi bacterium]|nr:DUF3078 domain-containing protein [Chlorobiota bacterium]
MVPATGVLYAQEIQASDSAGSLTGKMILPDSTGADSTEIQVQPDSFQISLDLLKRYIQTRQFWRDDQQEYRKALEKLIGYMESYPIDSTLKFLKAYPYPEFKNIADTNRRAGSPKRPVKDIVLQVSDTLREAERTDTLKAPADSMGIHLPDLPGRAATDTLPADTVVRDSLLNKPDTVSPVRILQKDTVLVLPYTDTTFRVYRSDTVPIFLTDSGYVASLDTLRKAVAYLIRKVEGDSVHLWITNLANEKTGVWLRNGPEFYTRFWLKNENRDSIGMWIQNLARDNIRLTLDDNVIFHRMSKKEKKQSFLIPANYPGGTQLKSVRPIVIKKNPWKLGGVGAVNLSQGMLSNWAKGGESSIATLWELNAFANFNKDKHKWSNVFRLKYGVLKSGDKGLRKNEDVWELDSRYGLKQSAHWYYSSALNLKSQIARGYKYPDDSTVVSRFFAPGYLYLSLGMDYRPEKKISILMSPLTWKATFVTDTALIDQTRYGLKADQKVRQDIGAYIRSQIVYDFSKDMSITSRLNLFSQYNSHPFNIDIDWELIYRLKLGPYFNVNVSTHMIYDDDIKFPVYDSEGNKTGKVQPRLQFKEWLNIGFAYKF